MRNIKKIMALLLALLMTLSCTGGIFATEGEPTAGEPEKRTYKVVFTDHDGTTLSRQTVSEGESAIAPFHPLRPGYRFMGWDRDFSAITGDLTVAATYRVIEAVESYGAF